MKAWFFFCFLFACAAMENAKPALDINTLELACVEEAASLPASRDCRNAIRRAWAKANGISIVDLPSGSDSGNSSNPSSSDGGDFQ